MPDLWRRLWPSEKPEKFSAFYGDPAKILAARALHSVLLGTVCFGALYLAVAVPFLVARKLVAGISWALIVAIGIACMLLLRRGRVRLSSWIFLSTAWLLLAMSVSLSGGVRSSLVLSHIAVVIVSAWLLGRRESISIAALSVLFTLSLTILEALGIHLPRYFPGPPAVTWAMSVALVGLAVLPLASVNQALADSARQAQNELQARLREEQVRAETVERFQATFFQAAVGIAHISLNGEWILINDRYGQMLGITGQS